METSEDVDLQVEAGAIVAQRLFDVCDTIDLAKAEILWAERQGRETSRTRLSKTPAKAVTFDVPPVVLRLDSISVNLMDDFRATTVTARLYDFGVIALSLSVTVEGATWQEFTDSFNAMDRAVGPSSETTVWFDLLEKICATLSPAMSRPNAIRLQEDYLLAVVRRWNEPTNTAQILSRIDLVPLLSGEKMPLSDGARRDLLRQQFSYYENDLVVLTWDRAFVCEPDGNSDVCDILEVANAQLLELRYYDELLDDELPRMYDLVEATRRGRGLLSSRRFANLAHTLYTLVAEVTELTEKVDNALHVTEDVYLARIYTSALETFRVPIVGGAVDRKLSIIRDTYAALLSEASGARGEVLEVAIIVLIIIEIVLAILRR